MHYFRFIGVRFIKDNATILDVLDGSFTQESFASADPLSRFLWLWRMNIGRWKSRIAAS